VTVLLDAFAVLAYFTGEPAGATVRQLLRDGPTAISSAQIVETVDRLVRVHGVDTEEAELACSGIGIELLPLTPEVAIYAGLLRAKHYGPTGRTLSFADSICAATALDRGDAVATADPILIQVIRAEGGTVVELPGST
jgi:PIN domain nuclease of toxin-antitoxin system